MLENIYTHSLVKYMFDKDRKYMTHNWEDTPKTITTEEYKKVHTDMVAFVELFKPLYVLSDTRTVNFIVKNEWQEWVSENVLTVYEKYGLKKFAFLISPLYYTRISIELAMEELNVNFDVMYFDDFDKAEEWLFN